MRESNLAELLDKPEFYEQAQSFDFDSINFDSLIKKTEERQLTNLKLPKTRLFNLNCIPTQSKAEKKQFFSTGITLITGIGLLWLVQSSLKNFKL